MYEHTAHSNVPAQQEGSSEALHCVQGKTQTRDRILGRLDRVPGAGREGRAVNVPGDWVPSCCAPQRTSGGSWSQEPRWTVSEEQHPRLISDLLGKEVGTQICITQMCAHTGRRQRSLSLWEGPVPFPKLRPLPLLSAVDDFGFTPLPLASAVCPGLTSVLVGHHSFLHSVSGLSAV